MKNVIVRKLPEFVRGIWEKGDGCPLSTNTIVMKLGKLFQIYEKYWKGEGRGVQQEKEDRPSTKSTNQEKLRKFVYNKEH